VKGRAKDPKHLRDKLIKKYCECIEAKKPFQITKNTLFEEINDLAGIRILHLYTRQIVSIDTALKRFFEEGGYKMIGPPFAYTWDDESRDYFKEIGIETKDNKRLYTSVHYVIEANKKYTVEIQVRTLAEELWGEVDHTINYPTPTENLACSEQIKVLARVTSSCTRLVDSIFKTYAGMKGR
jgi:ppGpp synthetase/RelA/SpoT-type nucleotidyltranferase